MKQWNRRILCIDLMLRAALREARMQAERSTVQRDVGDVVADRAGKRTQLAYAIKIEYTSIHTLYHPPP